MMTDITIPIWLLALSGGVPCVSFISLLVFILRKIRKPNKELFVQIPTPPMADAKPEPHQFHRDLLAQQIDAVFNGLNAIIETERVKMNTLLNSPMSPGMDAPVPKQDAQPRHLVQSVVQPCKTASSLDEQISKIAAIGGQPEEIADEMGLSQAEVELALQMRSSREAFQHRKLEAVA